MDTCLSVNRKKCRIGPSEAIKQKEKDIRNPMFINLSIQNDKHIPSVVQNY